MLSCVPYSESLRRQWDGLALARGSVFHTAAFRDILVSAFGYHCPYHAIAEGGGRLRALIPLAVGRDLAGRVAGVCLPFVNHADICAEDGEARAAAVAAIPQVAAACGLDYLQLRLKDQTIETAGWQGQLDNHTFELPLTGGEDAVLALSSAGNRNHVRKTYKNDWFTASLDPDHLAAFYAVYRQRMKQLGSPAPAIRFFQRIFACLQGYARLLTVLDRSSGRVVGGMVLLASPADDTLYYPYGASLVEYNGRYVNSFMYWEAARLGIGLGLGRLDLGRSPAGSGTYAYKAQWGAVPRQLKYMVCGSGGPPAHSSLGLGAAFWKLAPAFVTDRLGHTLIKHLMP